jgi:hypothetical protein
MHFHFACLCADPPTSGKRAAVAVATGCMVSRPKALHRVPAQLGTDTANGASGNERSA